MLSTLVLAAALAGAQPVHAGIACPMERGRYVLKGDTDFTAGFRPHRPTSRWQARVYFWIHSAKTGRTYWFLPYSGNGRGITTHLASVTGVAGAGWHPSDPDGSPGPLGDMNYLTADATYRFYEDDDPWLGNASSQVPAHILIPELQRAMWYLTPMDHREAMPIAFFDLVDCRGR